MKTKKPRSKRAAKPAVRVASKARRKAGTQVAKVATAKPAAKRKSPKSRSSKALPIRRVVSKRKTARKAVARRTSLPASNLLLKAEPQVPLVVDPVVLETKLSELAENKLGTIARSKAKRLVRKRAISQPKPGLRVEESIQPELAMESGIAAAPIPDDAEPLGKSPAEAARLIIPPILFEGDAPEPTPASGPGQKYALGPISPGSGVVSERAHLPSSYDTGKLQLVARDPHWLYAHWDLSEQQQRRYNSLSADRHLVVRVQPGAIRGHAFTEIHVHPESRHWFIHVDRAATTYTAELGYYPTDRKWVAVATSTAAATPPDAVSTDRTIRFATVSVEKPLRGSMMRAPRLQTAVAPTLEQSRERALATALSKYFERRESPSSADIPELTGQAGAASAPTGKIHLEAGRGMGFENPTSPSGGEMPAPRGFWLNVNAELVLYGATEPNATLLIDGYPVQLRPDGTFSYRFALPDGDYEVALWAMSADGDLRQAILKFRRSSNYEGEVGAHPQDPALTAPPAENK